MENRTRVRCPENEELATFMKNKWKEMAESPKGLSENIEMALSKAHFSVCNSKNPIRTIKDFSTVKGVGKMMLRLMQGFFGTASGGTEPDDLTKKGKKTKGTKRYMPQRNSVAYALLITLYRGTSNGNEFMRKQELIDAAEASGLSRAPIAPEKGKGKAGHFGSSPQDWYSGWSCMKTLISKGLVVKSSCPAKYMLTEEGKEAACDCLKRSGMAESLDKSASVEISVPMDKQNSLDIDVSAYDLESEVTSPLNRQKKPLDVPLDSLERGNTIQKPNKDEIKSKMNILSVPPLSFGERFEDAYEVILILDDREQFATKGSRSRKIIENICSNFKIQIEVRRLPVGDGIWIARHKTLGSEYVLDFIVERKKIDDLRSSIRDNRYKDQKLRLVRCGLKKLIYLVEGDPNSSEAAESIKTACFTTEILEGFDVQRTSGLGDTLRKYGHLTQAIYQYYKSDFFEDNNKCSAICPPYDEFVRRCQDLEKMTISDVFSIQLMQVPQVTEEISMAVLDLYPTLVSLACAYSLLDGDSHAQEQMLQRQSNNVINGSASRNIFQLVWGS